MQSHELGKVVDASLQTLNQRNVVALEENLSELSSRLRVVCLCDLLDFDGVVENEVHELIEALNLPFYPYRQLFV